MCLLLALADPSDSPLYSDIRSRVRKEVFSGAENRGWHRRGSEVGGLLNPAGLSNEMMHLKLLDVGKRPLPFPTSCWCSANSNGLLHSLACCPFLRVAALAVLSFAIAMYMKRHADVWPLHCHCVCACPVL